MAGAFAGYRSLAAGDASLLQLIGLAFDGKSGSYAPQDFVSDLRLFRGTNQEKPLLTVNNFPEIYELYFIIDKFGVDATYVWLKDSVIPKMHEDYERYEGNIDSALALPSYIIFDNPLLAEQRDREIAVLAVQAGEGIITDTRQCAKCEVNVRMKIIQDRSADEGPSTHFTCPRCACSWKEN
jgi:DNA-directed RNA polymerase subunit M/transcription elongation factor TFIIS